MSISSFPQNQRILFLDIDGVLLRDPPKTAELDDLCKKLYPDINSIKKLTLTQHARLVANKFNPESIIALNELCTKIEDLRIVISSTWKENRTVDDLKYIFQDLGFVTRIIDKTSDTPDDDEENARPLNYRAIEINEWLEENGALNFVIIDDRNYGYDPRNFVQVNPSKLLTKENGELARQIVTSTL